MVSFLLNLNRFHTCALFNENTLDFLEPQYSKGFFDSEPKYILNLFLSYTTNILLGLEKPELKTQVPSQTTHMYTCMHSHKHTHTHTHTSIRSGKAINTQKCIEHFPTFQNGVMGTWNLSLGIIRNTSEPHYSSRYLPAQS